MERRTVTKLPWIVFLCLLFPTTVLSFQFYTATVNITVGLFFDNFDEHVPPEAPDGWTVYSGTWRTETDGTTVYEQTKTKYDRTCSIAGDANWTDYIFQVKVKFVFPPGTPPVGGGTILFFRFQDESNYYFLFLSEDKDELMLYRRIGGIEEQIGSSVAINLVKNQWYDVRISIQGQIINVWADGTQYFINQESGGTITSGAIGVGTKRYSCRFDEVNSVFVPM